MIGPLTLMMIGSSAAEGNVEKEIAPIVVTSEYRPLVAQYAQCIAGRDWSKASDYVLRKNVEWTKSGQIKVRNLIGKNCVPTQATPEQEKTLKKMTPEMLRPAIADALVQVEFPTSDPRLIATAQPLPNSSLVEDLWPSDACKKCDADQRKKFDETKVRMSAVMAPYVFAECAVRADPQVSHRLLMTQVNSSDESAAFKALAPAFGQCVTEGSQAELNKANVRGLVALNYYRLAHAPRIGAAAGVTQ